LIKQIELTPLDGGVSFFIFSVQTSDSDYLSAKEYLAQKDYSTGTRFTLKTKRATYTYELREAVRAGIWAAPGDPKHFGQLKEPLLLYQISEVKHGN